MNDPLDLETGRLIRSWMRHDADWLRDYLVGSVEDPRLNVPSVLTRHFLIQTLTGDRFTRLMEAELRFAIVLTWLVKQIERGAGPEEFAAIRHALDQGADNAEGIVIPPYLTAARLGRSGPDEALEVPDYLADALDWLMAAERVSLGNAPVMETFMSLWRSALDRVEGNLSVLEAACGSANDYRAMAACGLDRLLDYTGFDLCEKNVGNACALFPEARFRVGNAFEIEAPNQAFEVGLAHDLFEHLSASGWRTAIRELCRVTSRGLSLGFFNLHEEPGSIIRPVEDYHWNLLSTLELRAAIEAEGFAVQILSVDAFLREAFGCGDTHNRRAYAFRCWRTTT